MFRPASNVDVWSHSPAVAQLRSNVRQMPTKDQGADPVLNDPLRCTQVAD